ncbi:preprotein translocase subunit SecE [Candidatus Saccharibacteria bacterium]|nr:preprotein translocase subunit SecE [Candidatus Saccharibacteria bacterium]
MAKITRIKATEPGKPKEKPEKTPKPEKVEKKKKVKKPFVLFRPFVALGRYLKNSWLEMRQVRWPSRKSTWKMVLAVFVYTAIFGAFLLLLDVVFDLIFTKLIG